MRIIIPILIAAGWAGTLLTLLVGYAVADAGRAGAAEPELARVFLWHLRLALSSAAVALLGLSLSLASVLGSTRGVGRAIAAAGLDARLLESAHAVRRRALPPVTAAWLLVMGAVVGGGAVAGGVLPSWLHQLLAWLAVLALGWAALAVRRAGGVSRRLGVEIERAAEAAAPPPDTATG